jgi:hypothetical protein
VARHRRKLDLGEAISFDSVLTVLTVLLVLRMVFFVPMVNLDKAKTVAAKKAGIWDTTAVRVVAEGKSTENSGYQNAFGLAKAQVRVTGGLGGTGIWIEAVLPDSSVAVVYHDVPKGRYVRLHAQSRTELPSCQYGLLRWSPPEKQWFTVSDSVDYGDRGVSNATLSSYRGWIAEGAK